MRATILAIETATSCCSVSLSHEGQISDRSKVGNNVHSQVVLGMVQDLLQAAKLSVDDLAAVAVGQGPGSFTGLRIGVGVAQGIAYGAACPMIGVSSLDALAVRAPKDGIVLAGIDARMGEVYWAEYTKHEEGIERLSELQVTAPDAILSSGLSASASKPIQLVGNAWLEYKDQLTPELSSLTPVKQAEFPSASALVLLARQSFENGEVISALEFAPEYVRNDVAKKSRG